MTKKTILKKVVQIKNLERQADKLSKEIDCLKNELKAYMEEKKYQELKLDIFTLSYKTVITAKFDTTAFKDEYSGLHEMFLKQSESKRFTISS